MSHVWMNEYTEVPKGECPWHCAWYGKTACRLNIDGESWVSFAWLPDMTIEKAEEVVQHDLGWCEMQSRHAGSLFARKPSIRKVKGGVFVRWFQGLDI